jgi:sulfatase modifying factor 1
LTLLLLILVGCGGKIRQRTAADSPSSGAGGRDFAVFDGSVDSGESPTGGVRPDHGGGNTSNATDAGPANDVGVAGHAPGDADASVNPQAGAAGSGGAVLAHAGSDEPDGFAAPGGSRGQGGASAPVGEPASTAEAGAAGSGTCDAPLCGACPGSGGPEMVSVGAFCIDSTEVTQGQYRAWLASGPDTGNQLPECAFNDDFAPDEWCSTSSVVCFYEIGSCENTPQVCVDWCDAFAFCRDMGKRLCGTISAGSAPYDDPSAGQWQQACAGANELEDCSYGGIAGGVDVATHPACAVYYDGEPVYDMHGNVSEWEDSCSASTGAADLCRTRGGNWSGEPAALTCQLVAEPAWRREDVDARVGFRCCAP